MQKKKVVKETNKTEELNLDYEFIFLVNITIKLYYTWLLFITKHTKQHIIPMLKLEANIYLYKKI